MSLSQTFLEEGGRGVGGVKVLSKPVGTNLFLWLKPYGAAQAPQIYLSDFFSLSYFFHKLSSTGSVRHRPQIQVDEQIQ